MKGKLLNMLSILYLLSLTVFGLENHFKMINNFSGNCNTGLYEAFQLFQFLEWNVTYIDRLL
jgi:hypothetical protein